MFPAGRDYVRTNEDVRQLDVAVELREQSLSELSSLRRDNVRC
jgi:hypothetical protein